MMSMGLRRMRWVKTRCNRRVRQDWVSGRVGCSCKRSSKESKMQTMRLSLSFPKSSTISSNHRQIRFKSQPSRPSSKTKRNLSPHRCQTSVKAASQGSANARANSLSLVKRAQRQDQPLVAPRISRQASPKASQITSNWLRMTTSRARISTCLICAI